MEKYKQKPSLQNKRYFSRILQGSMKRTWIASHARREKARPKKMFMISYFSRLSPCRCLAIQVKHKKIAPVLQANRNQFWLFKGIYVVGQLCMSTANIRRLHSTLIIGHYRRSYPCYHSHKRPVLVTTTFVKPRLNCDLNFVIKSSLKRPVP